MLTISDRGLDGSGSGSILIRELPSGPTHDHDKIRFAQPCNRHVISSSSFCSKKVAGDPVLVRGRWSVSQVHATCDDTRVFSISSLSPAIDLVTWIILVTKWMTYMMSELQPPSNIQLNMNLLLTSSS